MNQQQRKALLGKGGVEPGTVVRYDTKKRFATCGGTEPVRDKGVWITHVALAATSPRPGAGAAGRYLAILFDGETWRASRWLNQKEILLPEQCFKQDDRQHSTNSYEYGNIRLWETR
jgi:hypothetical protein